MRSGDWNCERRWRKREKGKGGCKNRHHFVSRQSSFSRRLLGIVNVTLLINVLRLVRLLFPFLFAPANSASLFLDYEKNVSLNCIPFDGTGNCLGTTELPILRYCVSFFKYSFKLKLYFNRREVGKIIYANNVRFEKLSYERNLEIIIIVYHIFLIIYKI